MIYFVEEILQNERYRQSQVLQEVKYKPFQFCPCKIHDVGYTISNEKCSPHAQQTC